MTDKITIDKWNAPTKDEVTADLSREPSEKWKANFNDRCERADAVFGTTHWDVPSPVKPKVFVAGRKIVLQGPPEFLDDLVKRHKAEIERRVEDTSNECGI